MGDIIQSLSLRTRIATILTILLFPGFYLYNAGLASGWFPQFLGGWYGPLSLGIGLPFLAYLATNFIRFRGRLNDRFGIFVYILVAYCFIWASINALLNPDYGQVAQVYLNTIGFLFLWITTFLAFKHLDYSSDRVVWILFFLWSLMFALSIANQHHGMYYAASDASSEATLRISSYQGFARSALVTSALIMVRLRGWKVLCFGFGAATLLFLLGARTEFVGIVLIILVSFIAGRGHWLVKVGVLAVATFMTIGLINHFIPLIDQSRINNLLNLGQDASWQTRQLLGSYAEVTIKSHWLFGAFGSEVQHGGVGSYAHNALSAWVSFGLVGFLLFVALNVSCVGYMVREALRMSLRTSGLAQFALVMSIYATICMIFSKDVGDPIFAISWGATAAVATSGGIRKFRRSGGMMVGEGST